ncbi:Ldh family oxidoreductase [Noviherbaspirillum aridicola]|uniref:Lactate dehydrogenase n=1 Tax=Noviherbaspirillum aridicola TaxID=2849687 RepID=A0ABQ4PZ04_9BURK|nr:Ldh family oxidoreductase [Noviherbaspirillum aridicola]GIZ50083.1 lactate dehydrogenase [Noviherbaspirillum aridicola]
MTSVPTTAIVAAGDLHHLALRALVAAGASELQARATATALVAADMQGLASHGTSRVQMYAAHLAHGRVDGQAVPAVVSRRPAAILVDAADGFAFPACELATGEAVSAARQCGMAIAAVTNSHHFGAAAYHLEAVAEAGMVGLAMGNSPAAMPFAGGKRAIFGTNPIAACFPRRDAAPLMIDLSLSEVARGKIMLAAQQGKPIPSGWALDSEGRPTTDAREALQGSMLPAGGNKGAMLALIVELLVTALTGASFGAEADSFFVDAGNRPRLGQAFIAIDPGALAGQAVYFARVEALLEAVLADEGVRLPGARRQALAAQAQAQGVQIAASTLEQLRRLAGA